ncbi:MAG: hypothetical protein EBS53_15105 [Bacteroidetes bacterium]|nr:hypothetical protein [Bacteroidota bacterium]
MPLEPNSARLRRTYEKAGRGDLVTLIVAAGQGHSFWEGFFRCQPLVDFLIERAHPSAHIIWGGGGRSDHFLAHFSILAEFGGRISLNLIDDATRTFLLPPIFRKWYPGGTTLSLMPMGRADGVVTQNLVYPLAGETLELGGRIGSSNAVAEDGWVEVRYTSGSLLLMEIFTPE